MKIDIVIDDIVSIDKDYKDNYFGIIVTSPPYYSASTTEFYTLDRFTAKMKNVFRILYHKLKYGRVIAVNISDIGDRYDGRIPLQSIFYNILEEIGFKYQETIIWQKPKGIDTAGYARRAGTVIQKKLPLYYYPDVIHEYILIYRKGEFNRRPEYSRKIRINKEYLSTVWYINTASAYNSGLACKHPIAFPVQLPYHILNYYGYRDEPVLDPFLGGATTVLAARKLNFEHAVGYEVDHRWLPCILENVCRKEVKIEKGEIKIIKTLGDDITVVRRR